MHWCRLSGADLDSRDDSRPNHLAFETILCVLSTGHFVICQINDFNRTLIFNVFWSRLVDEFKQVANADVKIFA